MFCAHLIAHGLIVAEQNGLPPLARKGERPLGAPGAQFVFGQAFRIPAQIESQTAEHGPGVQIRQVKVFGYTPGQGGFAHACRAVQGDNRQKMTHEGLPEGAAAQMRDMASRNTLFSCGSPTLTRR